MPRTTEDVETYLLQLKRHFDVDRGTYLLSTTSPGGPPIALRVDAPIVALRMEVGRVPANPQHHAELFRKLLEYNATDLLHVSYGIDAGTIVLSAALELENLDVNELEAALSDMDLAYARHTMVLRPLANS